MFTHHLEFVFNNLSIIFDIDESNMFIFNEMDLNPSLGKDYYWSTRGKRKKGDEI